MSIIWILKQMETIINLYKVKRKCLKSNLNYSYNKVTWSLSVCVYRKIPLTAEPIWFSFTGLLVVSFLFQNSYEPFKDLWGAILKRTISVRWLARSCYFYIRVILSVMRFPRLWKLLNNNCFTLHDYNGFMM